MLSDLATEVIKKVDQDSDYYKKDSNFLTSI